MNGLGFVFYVMSASLITIGALIPNTFAFFLGALIFLHYSVDWMITVLFDKDYIARKQYQAYVAIGAAVCYIIMFILLFFKVL